MILLSAAMSVEVLDMTKQFMRDPVKILLKKEELTLEGIKQFFVVAEKEVLTNSTCNCKSTSVDQSWIHRLSIVDPHGSRWSRGALIRSHPVWNPGNSQLG